MCACQNELWLARPLINACFYFIFKPLIRTTMCYRIIQFFRLGVFFIFFYHKIVCMFNQWHEIN